LTGRTDDPLTIFRPLQRCLYSQDGNVGTNEFIRWTNGLGFKSPAPRAHSRDPVVRQEERERTAAEAIAVMSSVIEQHKNESPDDGEFLRGHHLRLVYESPGGSRYVFIPRALSLNNLHAVVRGVVAEALEYRFRYKNEGLCFLALLSDSISDCNNWAIEFLNEHDIVVAVRP
jgi:hypothetical protein